MLADSKIAFMLPFEIYRIGSLLERNNTLLDGLGQLGYVCRLRFYHGRDGAPLIQDRPQSAVKVGRLVASNFV